MSSALHEDISSLWKVAAWQRLGRTGEVRSNRELEVKIEKKLVKKTDQRIDPNYLQTKQSSNSSEEI